MYTLLNRDKTLCSGVFPTRDVAAFWANTFLPELQLKPIELLTAPDTLEVLKAGEGWTWSTNRSVGDFVTGGVVLPSC